jgi:hypothetical protein
VCSTHLVCSVLLGAQYASRLLVEPIHVHGVHFPYREHSSKQSTCSVPRHVPAITVSEVRLPPRTPLQDYHRAPFCFGQLCIISPLSTGKRRRQHNSTSSERAAVLKNSSWGDEKVQHSVSGLQYSATKQRATSLLEERRRKQRWGFS